MSYPSRSLHHIPFRFILLVANIDQNRIMMVPVYFVGCSFIYCVCVGVGLSVLKKQKVVIFSCWKQKEKNTESSSAWLITFILKFGRRMLFCSWERERKMYGEYAADLFYMCLHAWMIKSIQSVSRKCLDKRKQSASI